MDLSKYVDVILGCSLFQGLDADQLPEALNFLRAYDRAYRKNAMIFMIGDPLSKAGIVLDGTVELSFLDEGDNSVNMNHFSPGSMFGESLACSAVSKSPVQMRALSTCRILFLDLNELLSPQTLSGPGPVLLATNLLRTFARQNVFLNQKVRILSQRKLRDKLKIFLRQQDMSPDGIIQLRFNRVELAAFLGSNRSALSRELSNMQEEGILEASGCQIRILDRDFLSSF